MEKYGKIASKFNGGSVPKLDPLVNKTLRSQHNHSTISMVSLHQNRGGSKGAINDNISIEFNESSALTKRQSLLNTSSFIRKSKNNISVLPKLSKKKIRKVERQDSHKRQKSKHMLRDSADLVEVFSEHQDSKKLLSDGESEKFNE